VQSSETYGEAISEVVHAVCHELPRSGANETSMLGVLDPSGELLFDVQAGADMMSDVTPIVSTSPNTFQVVLVCAT
jgi:hypothetical protein